MNVSGAYNEDGSVKVMPNHERALAEARARADGAAHCCHIPDDQQAAARGGQPYTRCPKPAEWEITEAKAPGYPTHACTEHA